MNKQALTIIIFLAITALVAWEYFMPAFNDVSFLRQDLSDWQAKLNNAQDLSKKLEDLKKKYDNMTAAADRIEQAVTKNANFPALLVQMEDLSSKNGLVLEGVAFNVVKDKKTKTKTSASSVAGAKVLAMDLSLNGSQSSLKNFLKAIETNLRIMDVSVISFGEQKIGVGVSTGQDFKVSLATYFRE